MESPDDQPRVKFLCSFGGTILPRPLDSRLRYVGGETRIVSLPRQSLTFSDLLARMQSLSPSAILVKYQQPDEDLDALVSLVNDDDLINMMEEYDKLTSTSADGFTRLRMFLFSQQQSEVDISGHFEFDDRETERRYVDALNSLSVDVNSPPSPDQFNVSRHESPAAGYSPRYEFPDDYARSPVVEKSGFPGNLGHAHNVFDGGSACEHCRMGYQRGGQGMVHDARYWKQAQMEFGNEYGGRSSNSCAECSYKREGYMMGQDVKVDYGSDRGWMVHHHQPGSGRVSEHFVDGNGMNASFSNGNFYDGHSNYVNQEDGRYLRPEVGSEMFHGQQQVGGSPQPQFLGFEDGSMRYGNRPPAYAADNLYQVAQNLPPIQSIRRKAQVPMRPGTSYESSGLMMPNGGMNSGFTRSPSPQDMSPRMSRMAMENQIQNSWVGQNGSVSQRQPGFDGNAPDFFYDPGSRSNRNVVTQDGRLLVPDHVQPVMMYTEVPYEGVHLAPTVLDDKPVVSAAYTHPFSRNGGTGMAPEVYVEKNTAAEANEAQDVNSVKEFEVQAYLSPNGKEVFESDSNKLKPTEGNCYPPKVVSADANATKEQGDMAAECLSNLPELIASAKQAAIVGAELVKARAEANDDEDVSAIPGKKEASPHALDPENNCVDFVSDSDGDGEHQKISKIEPTTAESEALSKGLQTIRNDDLEEIRQLGSGTYGSVFHGKWKGSDVAIKRIKASCFAGRPSERERLIADFWKEALILSSLHHPNVVSFYGVVRDGPDGSLATVTEFMVNGSLKQFLQKKDRTIDRRKRLIIAMDAAFGMEYLHGKNIVHFDLKCENLLVNMRDPHRPICKIGDLGLSKVKQHTLVSGGVRGTLPWMAPELLSGKCHMVTEKIDVYSFGIAMWELLTGEDPYADMHCASMIGGIVNNTLRPQIPTWCDPEWKALMESCWSCEPGGRPSFTEISQKLRKMAAAINVK